MSMRPTSQSPAELAPEAAPAEAPKGESFGLLSELRNTGQPAADGAPKSRKALSTTTVIMALVLVGSGGLLFGMRKLGTSSGATGAGIQIDYTRDQTVTAAMQEKVLNQLAASATPLQVPSEHLNLESKNPFALPVSKVGTVIAMTDDPDARLRAESLAKITARKEEIKTKLAEVHLQGVMMGKIPLARVDGNTVRAGDLVNELFTVKQINERSMVLTVDGQDFEVAMPEPGSDASSPNKKPASKPAPVRTQKKK
jgi:hypothetical protein